MYEIVVVGSAERALRATLDDLVLEWRSCTDDGTLAVIVRDRAALAAAISRFNDCGVTVEQVRRLR